MKTDDVIQQLVLDAKPVKRLASPGRRFAVWLALSFLYLAICQYFSVVRDDMATIWRHPAFIWQTAVMIGLAITSSLLAFFLSVPGREVRLSHRLAVGILALTWLMTLLILALVKPGSSPGDGILCSLHLALLGFVPAVLLVVMLRRAAPLQWLTTGILVGIAMTGIGASALHFGCANNDPMHLLVWHFLPGFLFVVLSVMVASRAFRR